MASVSDCQLAYEAKVAGDIRRRDAGRFEAIGYEVRNGR